ncbi:hypothetical protein CPB83DRAFT_769736, partial [Crepidotus variabilis]
YYGKKEQATQLEKVYKKWSEHGGIWSAGTAKVCSCRQLAHVNKGCLARTCQDIPTDGSQIEG